jgi:hypothetical protein
MKVYFGWHFSETEIYLDFCFSPSFKRKTELNSLVHASVQPIAIVYAKCQC